MEPLRGGGLWDTQVVLRVVIAEQTLFKRLVEISALARMVKTLSEFKKIKLVDRYGRYATYERPTKVSFSTLRVSVDRPPAVLSMQVQSQGSNVAAT